MAWGWEVEGDLVCHLVLHHLQQEPQTKFQVGRARRGTQTQRGKEEKSEEEGNERRRKR